MELTITGGGERHLVEVEAGANLLEALRSAGFAPEAPCGGRGTCGKCRVLISDAEGTRFALACTTTVASNMEVSVEENRSIAVSTEGTPMLWVPTGTADEGGPTLGLAFDIGTTTLVCRLVDEGTGETLVSLGRSNPQISYGADVISRITASVDGHLSAMVSLVRESATALAREALAAAGVDGAAVARSVVTGNTVMEHIAAGLDPTPIGVMPFKPETLFGADHAFLEGFAPSFFCPCVAGYVGGDVLCDLLALQVLRQEKPLLLLDLGTNGEMALGDETGVLSCATAAGPVFEGANIRFGMPAYPGAISHVALEGDDLALTVIGDVPPVGLCGTGLIDAVALMLDTGVVDETGRLLDDDETEGPLAFRVAEVNGETVFKLTDELFIVQQDIRCLQLAKSAVCAGILTLLDERDITADDIGDFCIAGGFSDYLNLEHAARLGLFPPELLDRARSIGNGAIEGATAWLISNEAREELGLLSEKCDYVELSTSQVFNTYYVETMLFPEED